MPESVVKTVHVPVGDTYVDYAPRCSEEQVLHSSFLPFGMWRALATGLWTESS